jgi:DNA-directed RNA polymerase subunit beta
MPSAVQTNFRVRKNLGRVRRIIDVPNLIDIQKSSYDKFLQMNVPPSERQEIGLQAVFRSVFPIKDFNGTSELVFVSYNLEPPKYDVEECRQRGMTFAAPIKVTNQLMIYDTRDGGERIVRDIKEQEVYFGELPLMTETGTFIINGTERVVVSQLHRSPGVFFDHDKGKTHSSGKLLYSARVIPYRGSWLDFEFDPKDIIYVRIDRRRKMHATVLLRALGYSTQDLLNYFYSTETVFIEKGGKYSKSIEYELLAGQRATKDIKIKPRCHRQEEHQVHQGRDPQDEGRQARAPRARAEELFGKVAAHDIIDPETGEVVVEVNEELTDQKLERLAEAKHRELPDPLHRRPQRRQLPARHAARRQGEDAGGLDHRDLPPPAPRVIRPRSRPRRRCSTTCSSTPSATTSRRSAASS